MQLYNADCFDIFPLIKDCSVDLVLCDMPYAVSAAKWDIPIPFDKMWEQVNRVIKFNGAIVLFGTEPFSTYLRMSNIQNYKYDWIWEKNKGLGFQHSKNMPMKRHENISVFSNAPIGHKSLLGDRRMEYNPQGVICKNEMGEIRVSNHSSELMGARPNQVGRKYIKQENFPSTVLKFNSVPNPIHSTEKPVALLEYLIKTYTEEGQTVLDFTAGSFSTMEACMNTDRNCICIEKDAKYFNLGVERIRNKNLEFNSKYNLEIFREVA